MVKPGSASLAAIAMGFSLAAHAAEEVNNGQDPTKPLTRIDLRYQYQNAPPASNDNVHILTPRADKPFPLGGGWSVATRVDLPMFHTQTVNPDNPDGGYSFGMGDVLLQALFIKTESPDFAWAIGAQAIFPTASEDGMGGGKYRLVPTLGARWNTPALGKGSWIALVGRYDFDVAGKDNRSHFSELQFSPIVNLPLAQGWFLNIFPSSDIRYNLREERPGDKGKWFVPFNFMLGKMVDKSTVASLEVGVPIINDYQVYDFKIEARIGFFF
jgi:hypothetical protein